MRYTRQQVLLSRLLRCNRVEPVEFEWRLPGTQRRFDLYCPRIPCGVELVGVSGMRMFGRHRYAKTCQSRQEKIKWCMKNNAKYVEVHVFNWKLRLDDLLCEAVAVIKSKRLREAARVFLEYSAEKPRFTPESKFITYEGLPDEPFEELYKKELEAT